jgi:pyroglutamyl-peptidase
MRRAPEVLADIPGVALRAIVLDTDYQLSERQFTAALDDFRPDIVLSFGLSRRIDEIKLERVAINVDDAPIPDNSGSLRRGQPISEDGPVGYWGTIPIAAILQALHAADIPAGISNHAGAYVCNHIYYFGLHTIAARGLPIRMGFIHVPPLPEMVRDEPGRSGMSMETLIKAARVIITTAAEPIRQG